MESPTGISPANEPIVIVLIPGDQPQSVPKVCQIPNAIRGDSSSETIRREVARLLNSSRSVYRSSRSQHSEKIHSSSQPMSNKKRKARMWHAALQKKLSAAKMMLAAQQTIEEIEEEIGLSVPRDTLNKLHSQFYRIDDTAGDPTAETYLAAVSAIRVEQQLEASESAFEKHESTSATTAVN